MELAWISLAALVVVVILSCTARVHPGFLALGLAWIIGVYVAPQFGSNVDLKTVLAGFPTDLFLILSGVSLLFTQGQLNGTLDRVAHAGVRLCRGNVGMIPWMFFFLAATLATGGAGNIAAAALLGPMAMVLAERSKIPLTLMTVMVGHGSLAGALSPISPTGIIAAVELNKVGLGGHEMSLFLHNMAANVAMGSLGFIVFGGIPLFKRTYRPGDSVEERRLFEAHFEAKHWITLAVIATLLTLVILFKVHLGFGAFTAAVVLATLGMADDTEAVRKMPWSVILMVSGVNVLTALLEKTGGSALFADLIARVSSERTAPAILGFVAAIVSVYSSTSGVVLPAFLPMVAKVVESMGGGDPLSLALAVIVAGHLVDVSPLSTIGALCIAGAGVGEDRQELFSAVLLWGMAMAVLGAIWCFFVF